MTLSAGEPGVMNQAFEEAREHHMAGRWLEAQALYQEILDADPQHADALHLSGVLSLQNQRYPSAIELISKAIEINPAPAKYHSNLGTAFRESGQHQAALASYRRALEADPQFVDAYRNMASNYMYMGETQLARACFETALDAEPDFAHSLGGFAWLLQQEGELDRAAKLGQRAVELDPNETKLQTNLAIILLKKGDAAGAVALCDRCLAVQRECARALSIKVIALAESGQEAASSRLMDLERLISAETIAPPKSYESLTEFNRDLAERVASHPSLMPSPANHATRGGWHTGELAHDDSAPLRAFKAMLVERVIDILSMAPPDPTHPFWAMRPARFNLNIWGVVMESQGHQVSHIHPTAWMGGVYYPELPPEVADSALGPAGWIEFGRGYNDCYQKTQPQTRNVQPSEGMLVTFPAYFWHRTIPFDSAQRRVSIAFDVVPLGPAGT